MKKKTSIPNYETKVPENVRKENEDKLQTYQNEQEVNEKSMANLATFL